MSSAAAIDQVAAQYGWSRSCDGIGGVTYQRGRRYVDVQYNVRGGVTAAATARRRFDGGGKCAHVLTELTRP